MKNKFAVYFQLFCGALRPVVCPLIVAEVLIMVFYVAFISILNNRAFIESPAKDMSKIQATITTELGGKFPYR